MQVQRENCTNDAVRQVGLRYCLEHIRPFDLEEFFELLEEEPSFALQELRTIIDLRTLFRQTLCYCT